MAIYSFKMKAAHDDTENLDSPKFAFEDFWLAYPRRVARKDAEKAWLKIDASQHEKIFSAVAEQRKTEDWRKSSGQYIPYPASYLRGERWLDELEADISMGQCKWNINGNRGPEPRCITAGSIEKNGVVYCKKHGALI